MLLESLLAKLAAAGLATKAAAAGGAVVVAASAAGAAGALPSSAQDAIDGIVGGEAAEVEAAPDLEVLVDEEQADAFGARVSADATGEADGESGVDGREIACEASEGRSGTCDDEEATDGEDDAADAGAFGERVSQDATGESDGEPGVDGEQIAEEAKDNGQRPDGAGEQGDDDAGDTEGDVDAGGPEGTPGESASAEGRSRADG